MAGLVGYSAGSWRSRALSEIFAVQRLIAIEAKIDDWKTGLQQAVRNTWFASESYLLLERVVNREPLLSEALQFGVGVVCRDQPLDSAEARARHEQIPSSYASWLFNEWCWRLAIQEKTAFGRAA